MKKASEVEKNSTTGSVINLGGSLSAISASPDGRFIVAAGRDVLKIVTWKDDERVEEEENRKTNISYGNYNTTTQQGKWEIVKNMRGVRKNSLKDCSLDVQWNPQFEHLIGTAATNGNVVIWSIRGEGKKQERVIKVHDRAVNRISWNPLNPNLLISGSQDSTVGLFDLRDEHKHTTFNMKSEVSDLKFHPIYQNYFAAVMENGSMQVWDIRYITEPRYHITAHHGLCLAINWHPTYKNILATAGRDKFIKIWDLNQLTNPSSATTNTLQSDNFNLSTVNKLTKINYYNKYNNSSDYSNLQIPTSSPVDHILWRPGHNNQIASSYSVSNKRIHLWDVHKPYIPLLSISDHKDVVTGMIFDPLDQTRNTLISCSKDSSLRRFNLERDSYRDSEYIRTCGVSWSPNGQIAISYSSHSRSTNDLFTTPPPMPVDEFVKPRKIRKKFVHISPPKLGFDRDTFVFLAKNYRISIDKSPSSPTPVLRLLGPNLLTNFSDLCDHNAKQAKTAGNLEVSQTWKILDRLFLSHNNSSGISASNDSSIQGNESNPPELVRSRVSGDNADDEEDDDDEQLVEYYEYYDNFENANEFDDKLSENSLFETDSEDTEIDNDDFTSYLLNESHSLSPDFVQTITPPDNFDFSNLMNVKLQMKKKKKNNENNNNNSDVISYPSLDLRCILEKMVEYHAEKGDVQTAVSVLFATAPLGFTIDPEKYRHYLVSYLELLMRFELYQIATEISNKSTDQFLRSRNQNSSFHLNCGSCQKALKHGFYCANCNAFKRCVVCDKVVKGLYVWCQMCGHGGHTDHMRDWFAPSEDRVCPSPGCLHHCTYTKKQH